MIVLLFLLSLFCDHRFSIDEPYPPVPLVILPDDRSIEPASDRPAHRILQAYTHEKIDR
jgi:hypothetical protein